MIIGLLIITGVIFIKYKPVYKVTVEGKTLGYVENRNNFERRIGEYINTSEEGIAFKTLQNNQEYKLEFVDKKEIANEDTVFEGIIKGTETIYTTYAILVNDEITSYIETEEKANQVVSELNEKYKNDNISIGIREIYSTTKHETIESDIAVAQISTDKISPIVTTREMEATARSRSNTTKTAVKKTTQQVEYVEKQSNANGITFEVKPVSGKITSKFGSRGAGRSSSHTGLDIAASTGTSIRAVTAGTVTFSQNSGRYGKMIKISHGNGVETWYAHCSELYASVGQKISAGEIIAAVGSTGNSTGPHLHLEIRIDGKAVNPQIYMY